MSSDRRPASRRSGPRAASRAGRGARARAAARARRSPTSRSRSPTTRASTRSRSAGIARELRSGAMSLYHYFDSPRRAARADGRPVAAEMLVPGELPRRLARGAERDRAPQPRRVPRATPGCSRRSRAPARDARTCCATSSSPRSRSSPLAERASTRQLLTGIVTAVDDYTIGYTLRELGSGGAERARRSGMLRERSTTRTSATCSRAASSRCSAQFIARGGEPPQTQRFERRARVAAGRVRGQARLVTSAPMAIEFGEKVRRIPVYPAADGYASEGPVAKLASNESPYPPIPAVVEAVTKVLERPQPLPRPDERRAAHAAVRPLRRARAAGSRSATAPATSCSPPATRCSSPAPSSSTRGRRFSRLPAPRGRLRRARDRGPARRRPQARARQDARGDHRRHAARDRLQPEQPDLDRAAARRDRGVRRRRPAPRRGDPRRGLRRVQRPAGPRRVDRAARAAPEPRPAAHLHARSTASAGCASATRCAAPRTSAPPSTRCASRSSATPPRRPRRSRRSTTRTRSPAASSATSPSGSGSRTGCASSASSPPSRRPTSSGSTSAARTTTRRGRRHARASPQRGILVRAGGALGRAGALRVTVGTEAENERFLEALGALL